MELSLKFFQPLLNMCQLMALEMGLLEAIVKKKGQDIDAGTLATEIGREELLIGRRLVFSSPW